MTARHDKAQDQLIARLHRKIGEAQFFLRLMIEQEPRMIGDKEPFDYYLSAFLNAGMSVRGGFQYRQNSIRNKAIKAWRGQWEDDLSLEEKTLYEFMRKDRVDEVHDSGSSRDVGQEGVPLPIGTHHIEGGIITISGPPGMEPAIAYRPTYSFTIGGAERKVTEACAAYLTLLQRMVTQCEADRP
jgi:hypothetical protein